MASSPKYSQLQLDESEHERGFPKPSFERLCIVILTIALVVSLVIIVGLVVGLGITATSNSSSKEATPNTATSQNTSDCNSSGTGHGECNCSSSLPSPMASTTPLPPPMASTSPLPPPMATTSAPPSPTATNVPKPQNCSDNSTMETTCKTETCQELASTVRSRMDMSINPCVNFYNFSCGKFESNARGEGLNSTSTLDQLFEANFKSLSDILQNSFDSGGVAALQKLKTFYDSCMDTDSIDSRGVQPLLELIRETGGWSLIGVAETGTWNINGEQFTKEKLLGSPAFYDFGIEPDSKDSTKQLLQVIQSGLTLGGPEFYSGVLWNFVFRDILVDLIVSMLEKLDPGISTSTSQSAAEDIADFEADLAQIFVSTMDLSDISATDNRMTIGDLSSLWADYSWDAAFHDMFDTVGITVDASEPVNVVTPSFFRHLHRIFNSQSSTTLKNYAKWQLLFPFIEHTDSESLELYIQFRRSTVGKATDDRALTCASTAESVLPLALARPFIDNILPADNTDSAGEMVNELKTGLKQRMSSLDWMDSFTRQSAKEKVDAITSRVGYPAKIYNDSYLNEIYAQYNFAANDYFGNFLQFLNHTISDSLMSLRKPVDRSGYLSPPTEVNAYYYPPFNQITILAGIMVFPIFKTDWPVAFRYGGLGGVVGHEITHGFDNQGRHFNPQGNLEQWWTDQSIQNYQDKTQCFVDQYSQFEMFGYGDLGYSVNGLQTLGENIADNGGMKASFQAYKSAAAKEGRRTLPGLSYSSDQLFFIAWAQQWCTLLDEISYLFSVLADVHSPGPFRVNGPVVNNPEFATAFNCPVGSPMNPEDKCLLW